MRRIFFAGACLLVLAGPGTGTAAAKKPQLAITSLSVHAGTRITPAETFRITGVIRNRGTTAPLALVSASLRRAGGSTFVLGAKNLHHVAARRATGFTLTATGPLRRAGAPSRRFVLVACVRPRRGGRAACRSAQRPVTVTAPAGGAVTPPGGGDGPIGQPGPSGMPSPSDPYTAGATTAGDRLFPAIGNGGYDATHYDLAVAYDPATKLLRGTATIDARALQNLSAFSFDLHRMQVSSVLVDGQPATFAQRADKLVVTPRAGIPLGTSFTTTVTYASPVADYTDPDGSSEGWVATSDGAFVVNEPVGSMSWFPNNDVPTDKATYDLHVTVPGTSTVIGSGRLIQNAANPNGTHTWTWSETAPMASYLVTATNGAFDFTEDTTTKPDVPAYYAVDSSYTPAQKTAMTSRLSQTPSILDFYAGFLDTAYPFDAAGGAVDNSSVGYSLETQTKPMYAVNSVDPSSPDLATIAHELAHQWFGDDVSPATWSDIWLNEGPAEFFSWLWQERSGTSPLTTKQRFDTSYADPSMDWSIPPAAPPTAADMFDTAAMYTRGAMVMEALREILGEARFKAVLKDYLAAHRYGNASTQQFIDLMKSEGGVSQTQLDIFFREWLYGTAKPGITPSNFSTYTPPPSP
jgi:aminopeptidase N